LCPLSRPWQLDASDDRSFYRQAHNNFFSSTPASPVQTATAGADTDTDTAPAATFGSSAPATGGAAPAELGTPAKRDQKQDKLDQAVVAFHKSLEEEIKVRGHNHRLPLLFASMLEHRAEKNTNFTIPTKEKWEGIRRQVVEGKGDAKGGKLITKWGLVIRPRGGQAEAAALAGLHTAQDVVLLVDRGGRRYVHQGEVFEVLMAALLEADNMKKLKEKVDKECCNITNVVVDDFLRALDVCYHLAGPPVVSAPAGNMRFECVRPPPDHKAYMQSENLQKVFPKVKRSLPDADLNETAAKRFKDFLARNGFVFFGELALAFAMVTHERLGTGKGQSACTQRCRRSC